MKTRSEIPFPLFVPYMFPAVLCRPVTGCMVCEVSADFHYSTLAGPYGGITTSQHQYRWNNGKAPHHFTLRMWHAVTELTCITQVITVCIISEALLLANESAMWHNHRKSVIESLEVQI